MFFAAEEWNGKLGRWEWLESEEQLEDRHMFKTAMDIKPTAVEKKDGISIPKGGAVHRYRGPLVLDIDTQPRKGIHTIEDSRKCTVAIFRALKRKYKLDPQSNGIKIYFSGSKGYHVEIDQVILGLDKKKFYLNLPFIYKSLVTTAGISRYLDMVIYSSGKGRMWRRPGLLRRNKGTYKTPITFKELINDSSEKHLEKARHKTSEFTTMNGVHKNELLFKLMDSAFGEEKVRKTDGLDHQDFKDLVPAKFDGADCIVKMLNGHPTVNKEANFHKTSLILCMYFSNMGYSVERAVASTKNWLKSYQSQTYASPSARLEHFKRDFVQVSASNYRFACGAARNIVENPDCAICPLNKFPDWNSLQSTAGLIEKDNTYQTGRYDKQNDEWKADTMSNGIFVPTSVGQSLKGQTKNQIFYGHIQYSDKTKSNDMGFDFLEFKTEETLMSHVQTVNGIGGKIYSLFGLSKKSFQGIRQIVGERMKNLPHYLSTGATHGAYKFKGEWYWADNEGSRDSKWVKSGNVKCDKPFLEEGGEQGYFKQHLTHYEPYHKRNVDDYKESIRVLRMVEKINAPHVMYLTMGWAVASFFRPRFHNLKSKTPNPNVHTFPTLFHIGKAQTGKTTLDNEVLIPLMGYGTESFSSHDSALLNIKMFSLTPFTLFMHIAKASNGCPIFLDEYKSEFMDGGSSKFTKTDMDTLCRYAYDRSTITRGRSGLGMGGNSIESAFKINTPKLDLNTLDQASYQRSVMVYADESASKQYLENFEEFFNAKAGKPVLQRIGATIAKAVVSYTDEQIATMLSHCNELAKKFFPRGGSRRSEGLSKIIFGHMILRKLFTKHAWDFDRAVAVCGAAYDIMDHGEEADLVNLDTEGKEHLQDLIVSDGPGGGQSDWFKYVSEILDLTSIGEKDNKLTLNLDYWFQTASNMEDDFYFVICMKRSGPKLNSRRRSTNGGSGVVMSDQDIIRGAKSSGILRQSDLGKDYSPYSEGVDEGARGYYIRLSVREMIKNGFDIRGIPGSEDALMGISK